MSPINVRSDHLFTDGGDLINIVLLIKRKCITRLNKQNCEVIIVFTISTTHLPNLFLQAELPFYAFALQETKTFVVSKFLLLGKIEDTPQIHTFFFLMSLLILGLCSSVHDYQRVSQCLMSIALLSHWYSISR